MARHLSSEVSPLLSNGLLTTLGEAAATYQVSVVGLDSNRIALTGLPPLALCTPVKILQNDRLWLGEIIECRAPETVVQIVHFLGNLNELSALAEAFSGNASPLKHAAILID